MVSSLKTSHSGKMELYIGSRNFLRIFTDAANHIPRHRRTKFVIFAEGIQVDSDCGNSFFSHLVDVLGPEDFLAPVCMLLIDKVANRVIRQNADEVQGSLALPISILQHYSNAVQILVNRLLIVSSP
jgi:U3 small nucleolar RNA-associated protein 10